MAGIRKRTPWDIDLPCTPEDVWLTRRRFLRGATAAIGAASVGALSGCTTGPGPAADDGDADLMATLRPESGNLFRAGERNEQFTVDRALTKETVAGEFNNFYEFTTTKSAVWRFARDFKPHPWTVEVRGEVENPRAYDYDDIIRAMPIEERVYRFRCVEAWAMTVPWMGFPFRAFLDLVQPTSRAKYVRFETFFRPNEAPGQMPPTPWNWPYYEGLTIEEAANVLTLMATGIYGHELPNQHGAPFRLVVPWKYGYKSIKSIVLIEFVESQPPTFWNDVASNEYDFWSIVNPRIRHPRWSQATETLIGTDERVPTQPYNGYGNYVHDLYKGTPRAAL